MRSAAALLLALAAPSAALPKRITLAPAAGARFALTHGVDRGPACDTANASVAGELRALRASVLRTHDAGVLDWCVLFPDPSRDPDDEGAWDFARGDAYFASILGAGLAPYFRVGGSWSVPSSACLDPDPGVFARVAVNTIRRYNEGTFGPPGVGPSAGPKGFPGRRIFAVEVMNEPDGSRFWNSTPAAFFRLFDATVRALKAHDPALLVGGPGVANTLAPASRPYAFGLLDAVAAAGTPIDFYSWHGYGTGAEAPEALYSRTLAAVRAYLDSRGLASVQQHVTEWASAILGNASLLDSPLAAAYVGAAMTYFAQGGAALATFYPACEGRGAASWGLFADVGDGTVRWRGQGRAYEAVAATLRTTPFAMAAAFAAEEDYAVLAGGDAAAAGSVNVVVSAQRSAAGAFLLAVPLGRAGGSARVSVFLIDAAQPLGAWVVANASVAVVDGVATVAQPFAPPAVAWVQLRA